MPQKSKAAERARGYKINDAVDAARLEEIKSEEGDKPLSDEISLTRLLLERAINSGQAGGSAGEKLAGSISSLRKQQVQIMRERGLLIDVGEIQTIFVEGIKLVEKELFLIFNCGNPPRQPGEPRPGYPMSIQLEDGRTAIRSSPPDLEWEAAFYRLLDVFADFVCERTKAIREKQQ